LQGLVLIGTRGFVGGWGNVDQTRGNRGRNSGMGTGIGTDQRSSKPVLVVTRGLP